MTSAAPKTVNHKFKWILKNATRENIMKHDVKDKLKTETIQTWLENSVVKWFLTIYYHGEKQSVALYFNKEKSHCDNLLLAFQVNMKNHQFKFEKPLSEIVDGWGWNMFIKLDQLLNPANKYIDEENSFTLAVEVTFTEILPLSAMVATSEKVVCSQFFNNKTFSDFKFKCSDGVELPVHRIVLADNSPVFLKMFTAEMKEKRTNTVFFEDITSDTMKAALEYIYTRKHNFRDVESTIKILHVSEKYEIKELKKLCIDELLTNVNKENALRIFETADLYNVMRLEKSACRLSSSTMKISKKLKDLRTLKGH